MIVIVRYYGIVSTSERDTGHDLRKLGVEDILISWFVKILALLGVASLFVCCMIHCKHLRLSDANKLTYLLTYLGPCGVHVAGPTTEHGSVYRANRTPFIACVKCLTLPMKSR